jgi:RNA polymerase sigma factor (sigma-70 family)
VSSLHERKFILRCIEGDKPAWDEFVLRFRRLVYKYIYTILRAKGLSECDGYYPEDIFQDFFVFLSRDSYKKLASYKGRNGCSLASWLRQVVINFTIDYIRQQRMPADQQLMDNWQRAQLLSEAGFRPVNKLIDEEKMEHLAKCIERLGLHEKYFLQLHINQGVSLKDIRLTLRVTRRVVDMRKARIIHKLRRCFKDKGFDIEYS